VNGAILPACTVRWKAVVVARAALVWDAALTALDMGEAHPLDPRRLALTVELMDAYGLLGPDTVVAPRPATDAEIELVHAPGYIETVYEASDWGSGFRWGSGLGTEDNPIIPGMHEMAALICGASIVGLQHALSSTPARTFSIAGGLHHAHHSRAAGFSVYNDAAVAIAVARRDQPTLRVLYLDIDAHHGDGVQEAFLSSADVLTVSIHQSGLYAFPGTGFPAESGLGAGTGFAVNVPMPRQATDDCFALAFDRVVEPLARAFCPHVVVAQLGVDTHHDDPQTELGLTLPGYRRLVDRIVELADALCEGRLAALGGGGYDIVAVVPMAWTWVMARLLDVELADEVPEPWLRHVRSTLGIEGARSLGASDRYDVSAQQAGHALELTEEAVREVRDRVFPMHGLTP
jgi:acetoin utilization protein AcuC